jgi:hypothetical protein
MALMSLRRSRWGRLAIAALCLLAIIDASAWWWTTSSIDRAISDFEAHLAASGWQIETGAAVSGGWPFSATIQLQRVTATRALGGTTIRWTAPSIEVSVTLREPQTALVSTSGIQTVALGTGRSIPVQLAAASVRIPLNGGSPTFDLSDLVCPLPSERPGGTTLRIGHVIGEVAPLAAGFTAEGVSISPGFPAPFDSPLALSAGIHLTADFPNAASPGASARAWHDAGGQVDIPAMTLQWGPLQISGSGSGGLDADLQPQGQARLEVVGAAEVLDAAGRAGLLPPGPEAAARAVLALLALAAPGRPIPLPIILADRTVTVAQFPLARLPMLDWNTP